jgi:uncharacterized protein YdeI (BOF family)
MKYVIAVILLLSTTAINAQATYLDTVDELKQSGKDGKIVALKGEFLADTDTFTYSLKDASGTIPIDISSITNKEIEKGDHITINGKLRKKSDGNLFVMVSYLRKNTYVKDPAHCCMPDLD